MLHPVGVAVGRRRLQLDHPERGVAALGAAEPREQAANDVVAAHALAAVALHQLVLACARRARQQAGVSATAGTTTRQQGRAAPLCACRCRRRRGWRHCGRRSPRAPRSAVHPAFHKLPSRGVGEQGFWPRPQQRRRERLQPAKPHRDRRHRPPAARAGRRHHPTPPGGASRSRRPSPGPCSPPRHRHGNRATDPTRVRPLACAPGPDPASPG